MLYPRDFGQVTAGGGNTVHLGVSYNSLRIQGNLYDSKALPPGLTTDADDCIFPNASLETRFGADSKIPVRLPLMTGALGSTPVAAKYWNSFAVGCALVGIPIVVGENVVGADSAAQFKKGRVISAPEMEQRIQNYLRYFDGYGAIIVQVNVEDSRKGVPEFLMEKYGDKIIIELKWGQGAKNIGGEVQVASLEQALFLKKRGYVVDPDPEKAEVQAAHKHGAIRTFTRHSRMGYTNLSTVQEVREVFLAEVERLRKLGCKRISLKTGAYGMEALAMAIKFASEAKLDLLTIDGAGGGTGMSPWNMMESWGVPSILLHAKAHEYAAILAAQGQTPVDLSFAGGFVNEEQIFKGLALGAPYTRLICMGRAMMIPGFLGSNIEGVLHPGRRDNVSGNWHSLPKAIQKMGDHPASIFAGYHDLQEKIGADEMKNIPYGAMAIWTLVDKLSGGLQQFLAGARKFSIQEISREEIASANRETERETGIPFITDYHDEIARDILSS
jgi:hypothetical protein